jgi:hypothetical protein
MNNPHTRGIAERYAQDQLINAPIREEDKAFRSAEGEAARADRLTQVQAQIAGKIEEARIRSEDRNLDRASREQAAREMRTLQESMMRMQDQTRRDLAAASNETRATVAANKPVTPVSPTVIKELSGARKQAEALNSVSDTFKDEYGGVKGGIAGTIGAYLPKSMGGSKNQAATDWWKNYENSAALVERHEKFGTALSVGEQAAWKKATIAPGMTAETIRENLRVRAELADKVYNQTATEYGAAGHRVGEAFPQINRGGGAPAGPAAKPSSKAERDALPPGTKYIGPDGREYVKR